MDPVPLVPSKATSYIFRLRVYSGHDVVAVSYANLQAAEAVTRYIEEKCGHSNSVMVDRIEILVNKKKGLIGSSKAIGKFLFVSGVKFPFKVRLESTIFR